MKRKLIIVLMLLSVVGVVFGKSFKPNKFFKPTFKSTTEKWYKVGDIVVDENNNPIAVIIKGNTVARDTVLGVALVQKENLEWALESAVGYKEKIHAMINTKTTGKSGYTNATVFYNEFNKWGDELENYPAWAYAKSYNAGGFDDWYIPSTDEFNYLLEESEKINTALNYLNAPLFLDKLYWTSNTAAVNNDNAYYMNFNKGKTVSVPKSEKRYVCLVREFNISNEDLR
ncbi:MAG: DUF1566 domain-containing protein [Spirochaetaceae bacterium]|nr:DUF1566 domain-containing protein [Spirochaetaceae bacterium]MBO7421520.1 DUF1566 domain-containing protein [Spirochaetaceae bacterium]